MAVQMRPDKPDNSGQVSDKTRTDTDTPLRGVRCPDVSVFLTARKQETHVGARSWSTRRQTLPAPITIAVTALAVTFGSVT